MNAAGSLPGDLHKLWRARDPKQYHLEYGYSCMGYEIAGRPRRQDGGAGSRGLRAGRRRLLPDDGAGDRHVDSGRRAAHHPDSRQSRLRQHRRAVAAVGCGGFATEYRCRDAAHAATRRRAAAGRFRRQRGVAGRAGRSAPARPRAIRAALADGAPAPTGRRPSSSPSIASSASADTNRGGTCRSPRSRRSTPCRAPEPTTCDARKAERSYL